jgi:hypothetical protein
VQMVRVFLSYSTLDKHLAGRVKWHFRGVGFSVFLAHEDLEPSDEWLRCIKTELKKCNVFIPLITSNFRLSPWTDQETGFAISREKSTKKCLILPLLVNPVALPLMDFLKIFRPFPSRTRR